MEFFQVIKQFYSKIRSKNLAVDLDTFKSGSFTLSLTFCTCKSVLCICLVATREPHSASQTANRTLGNVGTKARANQEWGVIYEELPRHAFQRAIVVNCVAYYIQPRTKTESFKSTLYGISRILTSLQHRRG